MSVPYPGDKHGSPYDSGEPDGYESTANGQSYLGAATSLQIKIAVIGDDCVAHDRGVPSGWRVMATFTHMAFDR